MSDAENISPRSHKDDVPSPPANLKDEQSERWAFFVFLLFLLILIAIAAWLLFGDHTQADESEAESTLTISESSLLYEPIQPLPLVATLDSPKITLGKQLFFDPRISKDGSIACVSCHDLSLGGVDGKVVSTGVGGARGEINTPSVFNSAYQLALFWDGRAANLTDQMDGPIQNQKEMGTTWKEVLSKLQQIQEYQHSFAELYHDGITINNIKDAIATFEKSLITPHSRFDRYLRGEQSAINENERRGYQLFKDYGCVACHQGINIGGNMFQVFGVAKDYFENRGQITRADLGRYNVTGQEEDRYRFRVPSLRNVALTAPYFHDGSHNTLEEAVSIMAEYQLGRAIPKSDIDLIIQFLRTLTGEYPYKGEQ